MSENRRWITVDEQRIPLDENGYLEDRTRWSPAFAETMAGIDGIRLTEAHWQIIRFVQDFYNRFDIAPPMRALVKAVKQEIGEQQGNSRYLYRLFPDGPARQVTLYAGLPKPVSCI